ncbi:MAG: glycosyltransferase family 2 protein [Vicinamibacterales bacterium]
MSHPVALDIVIVSFNTRDDLRACLASLHASPPACPHQICVVDNASTDGSVAMVQQEFPRVTVVQMGRNAGFAAANNAGIRSLNAPLVLLLNSDTEVPPRALDTLMARMDARGATAAGPRLVDREGRPEMSWGSMLSPLTEAIQALRVRASASQRRWARGWITRLTSRERLVDWVTGACLLVRRDAAERVGLLDERYFMYEEDVDFCAALRAAGGTILFTPDATVLHARGRSSRGIQGGAAALYDRSHVLFYEKHAPQWLPWLRWWKRRRTH